MNDRLHFWPRVLDFSEYYRVIFHSGVPRAFLISIIVTSAGTVLALLLTIPCSYALSRPQFHPRKILSALVVFTMLFNGGMIPFYLVVTKLKMQNTLFALFLPMACSAYNLILSKNFMNTIPISLEESARLDGASDIRIFTQIVTPLSKPLIAAMALFFGVRIYNDYFNAVLFMTSRDLYPLQMLLREMIVANTMRSDMSGGGAMTQKAEVFKMATIVISMIPILCVYPFLQKHFVRGLMLGSVKE
jgi:putative aldouronate transport system permease protein